ncbi:MAG: lysophospholipase [Gammaproteobacteria bacterium]|nr:lysophospholipase [Gammaproteobacteria bacterium]MYF02864.1 lysophospholipase [Gammaproteobacteria bacterium]MYI77718.1 lysophospholipase [Gammaproteobacteria bacterium]
MRFLKRIGKIFGSVYVVICAVLWGIQGSFIFHPVSSNHVVRNSIVEYEVVVDESRDIKSRGYIVNQTEPGPVVLFFTGNASDAVSYIQLLDRLDVSVVLSNYRGYGKSDGRPSEKTLLADAQITLKMVRERFPDRPVVLMGSSMGSAVAIRTTDSDVAGVILISPFRSMVHIANRSVLRIFPVRFLMRHKFDTRASLESLPDQVLVMYSRTDRIIPPKETERVLEKIPQAEVVIDRVHHNAILGRSQNLHSIREWLAENFQDSD